VSPAHVGPLDAVGLSEVLGIAVDPGLLRLALTHRSFAYENGGLPHNERLEFLGDSVLSIVVTDSLFRQFPDLPEGRLAKMRASVVNMRALADVARGMGSGGLGAYLRLGRGEEATGGRNKASILADALEAVLGAVYLDQGTEIAHRVVHALFDPLLAVAAHQGAALDWKTSLQELTAALGLGVPEYAIESEGPDHERRFTARAVVKDEQFDACEGRNKKEAEQAAAEVAVGSSPPRRLAPGRAVRTELPTDSGPPTTRVAVMLSSARAVVVAGGTVSRWVKSTGKRRAAARAVPVAASPVWELTMTAASKAGVRLARSVASRVSSRRAMRPAVSVESLPVMRWTSLAPASASDDTTLSESLLAAPTR